MNDKDLDKGVDILQGIIGAANAQAVLPGMEEAMATPADVPPPEADLPPEPLARPAATTAHAARLPRPALLAAAAVLVVLAAVSAVAAWKLIPTRVRTVTKEVVRVEKVPTDAIPVSLLGSERDILAWRTVSRMAGSIGNVPLKFECGEASQLGKTYRVILDFFQTDRFVYVKVAGDGVWVAKVDAQGTIVQSYPCRRPEIPLRQLLGAR